MTDPYDTIHPFAASVDASALISFSDEEGAKKKRAELIQWLWGTPSLPAAFPTVGSYGPNTAWPNLARVDSLSYTLAYGFNGLSQVFVPQSKNGKLVVYHEGHNSSFYDGQSYIKHFIAKGFTVAALSQPCYWPNNQPTLTTGYGPIVMKDHRTISLLERAPYSPLTIFIEPVVQVVNQLNQYFSDITMIGYSGGGWTTHLAAALDERITRSYPVAGSLPKYLKTLPPNDKNYSYGDWEQNYPEFYQKVDWTEIYALSTTSKRSSMQMLNQYDPCCWAGVNYQSYEKAVSDIAASWGGKFSIWLDEHNPVHSISDAALAVIDKDMGI